MIPRLLPLLCMLLLVTALLLLAVVSVVGAVNPAPAEQDPADAPPPGMLSYWPLDDRPDATAFLDVVGNNDGYCDDVEGECPESIPGVVNSALSFDSSALNQVTASADDPSLNWESTDSFSFELWVKLDEPCPERKTMIGKYRDKDGGSNWASWAVGCGDDDRAFFVLRDSLREKRVITSTTRILDGRWHHLVAGRDASTETNLLYVDGTLVVSATQTYAGDFISDNRVNFGYYDVAPYYHLDGAIDEVAIYDRMLSPEEILAHYNGGEGRSHFFEHAVFLPLIAQGYSQ